MKPRCIGYADCDIYPCAECEPRTVSKGAPYRGGTEVGRMEGVEMEADLNPSPLNTVQRERSLMRRWLWTILVAEFVLLGTLGKCVIEPAWAKDTNPPDVQKWFQSLDNNIGGSCCGEADGYPAVIDEEATPGHFGRGHVIDWSEKPIIVDGHHVKTRPEIIGPKEFQYDYDHSARDKHGNPFSTAYVFLSVMGGRINGLAYCVVRLPPGV